MTTASTKSVKKVRTLREIPKKYTGHIFQGNRLTESRYDFTLIHERIFVCIMVHLQDHIDEVMRGKPVNELFHTDYITIEIPMKAITHSAAYYPKVRAALHEMAATTVEVPIDYKGSKLDVIQGLFRAGMRPDRERNGNIIIFIDRPVAKQLLFVEYDNEKGHAVHYTRYLAEVCLQAKNKYTPRIYRLLCSYRKKGGYKIPLDKFRELLQLGDAYSDYKDLKKRILKPVADELREIADLYFNVADADFTEKEGKKITGLNFKIIAVNRNVNYRTDLWQRILNMLQQTYRFSKGDLLELQYIFDHQEYILDEVFNKLVKLIPYVLDENNRFRDIKVVPYVLTAMKKEFPVID